MRKFDCEASYLLLQLMFIEFKTFILTLKVRYFLLKRDNLFFDKRMLIVKKRNALLQYRSRAVLVNQFFDAIKKSHMDTHNALGNRLPATGAAKQGEEC